MRKFAYILFLLIPLFFIGCDKGIEPYPEPVDPENTGFAGTITFTGEWPSGIKRTHIVLFKERINVEEDFFPPNLSYVSDNIDSRTVSLSYNSRESNLLEVDIEPRQYSYIVVAQSTKEELSLARSDWFVVGAYYVNGNTSEPGKIAVSEGEITGGVDIICDFDNPPPQPPGG